MAKPDKTDLINASVALSMKTWAKATINLNGVRERERLRLLQGTVQDRDGVVKKF